MGKCIHCGKESGLVSQFLGLCRECILKDFLAVESHIRRAHQTSREPFRLPSAPPDNSDGLTCTYCLNQCRQAAEEAGLRNVRIGNVHLLGKEY